MVNFSNTKEAQTALEYLGRTPKELIKEFEANQ